MADAGRTLVVAAYEPELAGLRERWATPIAAGRLALEPIGIGLVEASAGAERVLAQLPERVILVGTAGTLSSAHAIGAVVVARAAELVVRPTEYLPAPMARRSEGSPALCDKVSRSLSAAQVVVASPLGITSSNEEAARLAVLASVEQLECFALFRAAERAKVSACAIFAIANRVGQDAAAEWRANRVAAEAAAQEAVARAVGELLPCPPV